MLEIDADNFIVTQNNVVFIQNRKDQQKYNKVSVSDSEEVLLNIREVVGNHHQYLIRGMKHLYLFDSKKIIITTLELNSIYNKLSLARYLMEVRPGKDGDLIVYFIEFNNDKN
jgi:cation transport regulator ChaC